MDMTNTEPISLDPTELFGGAGMEIVPDQIQDPDSINPDEVWHPQEEEPTPVEESVDESDVWYPGENETPETPSTVDTEEDRGPKYDMDPNMYVYVDMEFTSLERDADYISIGLCDKEGHSFYAEFNDFSFGKVSEWTFKNVCQRMTNPPTNLQGNHWEMRGNRHDIRLNLLIWLDAIHNSTNCGIQFVGDCCHYDMVFLIDLLWSNALKVPEWISPVMVDINDDLSNLVATAYLGKRTEGDHDVAFNPYHHAFNLSRDEYASHITNAPRGLQHNAMYDAYVIRAIHQSIWAIEPGELTPLVIPTKEDK